MNKTKRIIAGILLAITTATAATLEWDPASPQERVTRYWLEHRPTDSPTWTRVEVEGTQNQVTIPESAFGRWFRIAAVNDFGQGEWSEPQKLPERVRGLKLIVEITP